jgi:hypothetical protein
MKLTRRTILVAAIATSLSVLFPWLPWLAVASQHDVPVDLAPLGAAHPRLYLPDVDLQHLRMAIRDDAELKAWHEQLRHDAEKLLDQPPVERVLIGPRLLSKSKTALSRISLLAGVYQLDGEQRFADRAVAELVAICNFSDWHPAHFLDVAEMTHAAAVGYDWLYDRLTPEQRNLVRGAIVEKGLKQGLLFYRGENKVGFRWDQASHNWNQVCNGGMIIGALAVGDDEPDLASQILTQARQSLPLALESYAPDGGWAEGPGYWNYATTYTVYLFAALHSALQSDLGLSESPGLADAGMFRIHTIGPRPETFNFADAHSAVGASPAMFWLAKRYARPIYAAHERQVLTDTNNRPSIFHLLWRPPGALADFKADPPPLDAKFEIGVVTMRSSWDDPKAWFVGFKGGDNKVNHSHVDLGSFVLDALGYRWAVDLGPDDYNLPGYFGKDRFTYYRLKTEGHNVFTVNAANQPRTATAPITAFSSKPTEAFAVADLKEGYAEDLASARRGVRMCLARRAVLIQDEIEPPAGKSQDIIWAIHTPAQVELHGDRAILKQEAGGRATATLTAAILSPPGAAFQLLPCNPPAPQGQQPNVRKLAIVLKGVSGPTRVAVVFAEPSDERRARSLDMLPLDRWSAAP